MRKAKNRAAPPPHDPMYDNPMFKAWVKLSDEEKASFEEAMGVRMPNYPIFKNPVFHLWLDLSPRERKSFHRLWDQQRTDRRRAVS